MPGHGEANESARRPYPATWHGACIKRGSQLLAPGKGKETMDLITLLLTVVLFGSSLGLIALCQSLSREGRS